MRMSWFVIFGSAILLYSLKPATAQELILHYTFDETDGVALDSGSGAPANGTLGPDTGRTTDTPFGATGFALDLSAPGFDSFLDAGDVEKVDTLASFTLTTWLKLDEMNTEQGGSRNVRLLAKQAPDPFNGISWNINDPTEGDPAIDNIRLGLFVGGEQSFGVAQSTENLGAENWTFLAATYDGTEDEDNILFFVGDELAHVVELGDPISASSGPVASTAGEANFGIGITAAAPGTDFAAGGFQDDVRVYDGVLTAEQLDEVRLSAAGGDPRLLAGDADQDLDFDQIDLVRVQIAAKYLAGQAATWGEGDWNGAPGGQVGMPPAGDNVFDQLDIVAALTAATYLTGPYAAVARGGRAGDGQTSVGYDASTGEIWVDAAAGTELTSVNIDSESSIFTGSAATNLGGSFDNDTDGNIFKATFGGSFGSISFGNVAQTGLSADTLAGDLTVVGSLAGGGPLGNVDLIYVPEPAAGLLMLVGVLLIFRGRRKRFPHVDLG